MKKASWILLTVVSVFSGNALPVPSLLQSIPFPCHRGLLSSPAARWKVL